MQIGGGHPHLELRVESHARVFAVASRHCQRGARQEETTCTFPPAPASRSTPRPSHRGPCCRGRSSSTDSRARHPQAARRRWIVSRPRVSTSSVRARSMRAGRSAANELPAPVSATAEPASPRQTTLAFGAVRTLTRTVSSSRSAMRFPGETEVGVVRERTIREELDRRRPQTHRMLLAHRIGAECGDELVARAVGRRYGEEGQERAVRRDLYRCAVDRQLGMAVARLIRR